MMGTLSEKGVSYMAGFFMLVAFAVGGTILGGMLAIPAMAAMSGKSMAFITENLNTLMGNSAFLREMQVMQTLSAVFGFLAPTLFTASRLSHKPITLTGFKGSISQKQILLSILIIICGLALSGALGYFSYKLPFPIDWRLKFDRMENNYAQTVAGIVNVGTVSELLISLFVLAFVPAVCEEAFFRGGLQNYLYRGTGKFWLSIVIVSIIFSAVHFSIYGFLSRLALGVVLGLLYQYSGRIWLNILAHFINNATAVMLIYFQLGKGKPLQEILNDREGSYLGFLIIPILVILLIRFKQTRSITTNAADGI